MNRHQSELDREAQRIFNGRTIERTVDGGSKRDRRAGMRTAAASGHPDSGPPKSGHSHSGLRFGGLILLALFVLSSGYLAYRRLDDFFGRQLWLEGRQLGAVAAKVNATRSRGALSIGDYREPVRFNPVNAPMMNPHPTEHPEANFHVDLIAQQAELAGRDLSDSDDLRAIVVDRMAAAVDEVERELKTQTYESGAELRTAARPVDETQLAYAVAGTVSEIDKILRDIRAHLAAIADARSTGAEAGRQKQRHAAALRQQSKKQREDKQAERQDTKQL